MTSQVVLPFSIILTSSMSCLFLSSWAYMWIVMEMAMVGMVLQMNEIKKKEKILLFFIFQVMPSVGLLVFLSMNSGPISEMNPMHAAMLVLSMVMKMGLFPLHMWALKVSLFLSWTTNFTLMTIQKIIPMTMLMKLNWKYALGSVAVVSMAVMTFSIMSISSLKPFIMSSSIIHTSWMIMSLANMKACLMAYLSTYSMMLLLIMKSFSNDNTKLVLESKTSQNPLSPMKVMIISLSGIPPFMGFLLKMLVIFFLMKTATSMKLIYIMVMAAMVSFYAYVQMIWKNLMLMKSSYNKMINSTQKMIPMSSWLNLMPMGLIMLC